MALRLVALRRVRRDLGGMVEWFDAAARAVSPRLALPPAIVYGPRPGRARAPRHPVR